MNYPRLVRDRIPEMLRQEGAQVKMHVANEQEYRACLEEKLREEVNELLAKPSAEELADVYEVLEAIRSANGIDAVAVFQRRNEKAMHKGAFKQKYVIDEVSGR